LFPDEALSWRLTSSQRPLSFESMVKWRRVE
jgi:hypothetical protein